MKTFLQFVKESTSLASIHGRRLGLVPDGHGSYHDKNTGEFIAKNVRGRLKFYNQNQIFGGRDPSQVRTQANQSPVATQNPNFKKKNLVKINPTEEINKDIEKELREKYISGEIFKEGSFIESIKTGMSGKIVRRGTNHLICVTEQNEMFKCWISDVKEWTTVSGVPATQREVGTDSYREYVMGMSNIKKIKNFINKHKEKNKH